MSAAYDGRLGEDELRSQAAAALMGLGLAAPRVVVGRRDDASWAERWKEFWKPMRMGERLWVVPSWERRVQLPPSAIVLSIDPGLAFGTGQHATTALCLEILDAELPGAPRPLRLLDVGCGSGVLAIAAAKLGVRPILAIDNDPLAVEVTRENVDKNAVGAAVRTSGEDLGAVRGRFDWVVANVITHTLLELREALLAHLTPGGTLVLSGILATEADELAASFEAAAAKAGHPGLRRRERRERDGWVALRFAAAS